MLSSVVQQLRAREPLIRKHWEALLRVEPVNGPLANPDTMVNLIPRTLEEIFTALTHHPRTVAVPSPKDCLLDCNCGNNPYIAYFIAAEQALVEALVLLQAEHPHHARDGRDVTEMKFVVRTRARQEIDSFCGICVHRGTARGCRHALANA